MNTQNMVGRSTRPKLPLIGHGLQLRRPLEFFAEMYERPEPFVCFQLGRHDAYMITKPELVLRFLQGKESYSVEKGGVFDAIRSACGDGVATTTEPKHSRHRLLMQPAFHLDHVASYVQIMQREASAMIDSWADGARIQLDEQLRALALRITVKTLFNSDVGEEVVEVSARDFPTVLAEIPKRTFLPWLSKVPLRNRSYDIAKQRLDDVIYRSIAEYRARGEDYGDLVSMLLAARFDDGSAMTDQQIHDEVMICYVASLENITNNIAFAWYETSRRPDIRDKVEREVAETLGGEPVTVANVRKLVYVERVVAEALRRYPPSWLNMRQVIKEFDLEGVTFPVGATLVFSPYIIHNDARHYPNPDQFDPDRWTMDYRNKVTRSGLFQPFGIGKHSCLGEPMAWFESVTVLATMAARLHIDPADSESVCEVARMVVGISELPITVRKRETPPGTAAQPNGGAASALSERHTS